MVSGTMCRRFESFRGRQTGAAARSSGATPRPPRAHRARGGRSSSQASVTVNVREGVQGNCPQLSTGVTVIVYVPAVSCDETADGVV